MGALAAIGLPPGWHPSSPLAGEGSRLGGVDPLGPPPCLPGLANGPPPAPLESAPSWLPSRCFCVILRRMFCTLLAPQPFHPRCFACRCSPVAATRASACPSGPASLPPPPPASSAAAGPCEPAPPGGACSAYSRILRSRMASQYAPYMASTARSFSASWHHHPSACSHCCLEAGSSAGGAEQGRQAAAACRDEEQLVHSQNAASWQRPFASNKVGRLSRQLHALRGQHHRPAACCASPAHR